MIGFGVKGSGFDYELRKRARIGAPRLSRSSPLGKTSMIATSKSETATPHGDSEWGGKEGPAHHGRSAVLAAVPVAIPVSSGRNGIYEEEVRDRPLVTPDVAGYVDP
jgi:hypothetical protein